MTTLFCNEQLTDAVAEATDATAPVTPPLGLYKSRPRSMPASFLPSPCNFFEPHTGTPASLPLSPVASGKRKAQAQDHPDPWHPSAIYPRNVTAASPSQEISSPLQPEAFSQDAAFTCAQALLGASSDHHQSTAAQPQAASGNLAATSGAQQAEQAGRDGGSDVNGPQCGFCLTRETPQWRDGPDGPRTACNACSTAWQRARRPAKPWLPGRVARMHAARAAAAATAMAA